MLNPYRVLFAFLAVLALPFPMVRAQQPGPDALREEYVRAHYTKYEYRIAMRDGKRLFTFCFCTQGRRRRPVPVPDGADALQRRSLRRGPVPAPPRASEEFEKSGYIFVYQDVRGRWMSEGEYLEMRPHIDEKNSPRDVDDSSDTYDTIEFLLKHVANNNGKVGIWGISYPGFYTSASIIDLAPGSGGGQPAGADDRPLSGRR